MFFHVVEKFALFSFIIDGSHRNVPGRLLQRRRKFGAKRIGGMLQPVFLRTFPTRGLISPYDFYESWYTRFRLRQKIKRYDFVGKNQPSE